MFIIDIDSTTKRCKMCGDMPEDEIPDFYIKVDTLPDRDINDYLYINNRFVYDPLPESEPEPPKPTQLDIIEAQVFYTAMETGTLIEV